MCLLGSCWLDTPFLVALPRAGYSQRSQAARLFEEAAKCGHELGVATCAFQGWGKSPRDLEKAELSARAVVCAAGPLAMDGHWLLQQVMSEKATTVGRSSQFRQNDGFRPLDEAETLAELTLQASRHAAAAASCGHPAALVQAGLDAQSGRGRPLDAAEAAVYFERAKACGHPRAAELLALLRHPPRRPNLQI